MAQSNRLIVDETTPIVLKKKGEKIVTSTSDSVGYSMRESEEDVVELRFNLDGSTSEPIYLTRSLIEKLDDLLKVEKGK